MDEPVRGAEGQSVLTKVADLIDYIEPFIDRMPRADKGHEGLGTKLRGCIYAMAERTMDTRKCRYAKSTLRMKRGLKHMVEAYRRYEITAERARATFGSYTGMLKHTDSKALTQSLYDGFVLTHASREECNQWKQLKLSSQS